MPFNLARYAAEQKVKNKSSHEEKDADAPDANSQDDFVEKALDADESDDKEKSEEKSLIGGGGLLKILQSLKDVMSKGLMGKGPDLITPIANPFEILYDEDFDDNDETVQTFKSDLGGCGGMIRIMRIEDPKMETKLSQVIAVLSSVREASRNQALRGAFADIHAAIQGDHRRLMAAAKTLTRLANDASSLSERSDLLRAGESVLHGGTTHLDAAAFRVRRAFASKVPTRNLRVAYTTLRHPLYGEPVQQCPKALHQLGRAEAMPISVCRDQCIDSRVQTNGRVACAYADWTRLADTNSKAMSRLETLRHPDNAKNSLNLAEGERSKPLTDAEKSIEQRMNEDLKGRDGIKSHDSIEKQLSGDKVYGHKDDSGEESIFSLNRKASKIDPESEDTLGSQIEKKGHENGPGFGQKTIEEMLEDEHVGLSEEDLDKILEEWLDDSREKLRSESKKIEKRTFEGVKKD